MEETTICRWGRIRHLSKTIKVGQITKDIPIVTRNRYETTGATAVAGLGVVSGVNSPNPRAKMVPPLVAKVAKVDNYLINAIKAQTIGQIVFEYALRGLKIRTDTIADYKNVPLFVLSRI